MKISNILRLSTALTLVVSVSSYSIAFAAQKMGAEESIVSLPAHLMQQSMDQRLQELEAQRDLTDFRDYPRFKELTNEISSMLGTLPDSCALPKGEGLHRWIDSIIRTRHKFSGQVCLGKYGIANRYLQRVEDLDSPECRNHIAIIMAIDAMAKLAIKDEEFSAMWSTQALDGAVSDEFVAKVLDTLNAGQFGWPKRKVEASLLMKTAPVETDSYSATIDPLQKAEKQTGVSADAALDPVVKDIFDQHSQRCDVFNTPLNEVLVDGEVQTKTDAVDQKTQLINTVLKDKERVDVKRHASNDEKKAILQAVMGAEIATHAYQGARRQELRLAPQLPTGLKETDPRFKHFEILRLTEKLSHNLVMHVKGHGYDALNGATLNGIFGDTYIDLFAYSGLKDGMFFDWFKEVFEGHKAGFVASIKRFEVDDLTDSVRTVLTQRPDIVRLAGDIFDLYAPKLDLKTVYTEVMPSGGKWRGWDVHQVDSFAHVISLTEEENEEYPETFVPQVFVDEETGEHYTLRRTDGVTGESYVVGTKEASLETQLRTEFRESLGTSTYELYSTSHKAGCFSEDILLATVKYVYDHCLEYRGHGVVGKGKISFNLTRNVKSELTHLFAKKETLDPDYITELYASTLAEPSLDMYDFWYKKGMAEHIYRYSSLFFGGADPEGWKGLCKRIELIRESADLGDELAKEYLAIALNNYAVNFMNGTNGVEENLPKAIELFRESAVLGCELAKYNLAAVLNNQQACDFMNGTNGIEKNLLKAIELLRESADLGYELARKNLAMALNNYADQFFNGTNGVEKNIFKAIKLFWEASDLGDINAKENSINATKLFREKFNLDLEPTREILSLVHNNSTITWGNSDAALQVYAMIDPMCQYSHKFMLTAIETLSVSPDISFTFVVCPILGANSVAVSKVMLAATLQGSDKTKVLMGKFISIVEDLTRNKLIDLIKESGIDVAQFRKDEESSFVLKKLTENSRCFDRMQLLGVPSVFIKNNNGPLFASSPLMTDAYLKLLERLKAGEDVPS